MYFVIAVRKEGAWSWDVRVGPCQQTHIGGRGTLDLTGLLSCGREFHLQTATAHLAPGKVLHLPWRTKSWMPIE